MLPRKLMDTRLQQINNIPPSISMDLNYIPHTSFDIGVNIVTNVSRC